MEAKVYIVSGGAIGSAALLLHSGLDALDKSKAVGRYLMRHYNAVVASIFPFKTNPQKQNHKQVAITHFYEDMRKKLGTAVGVIQDMCMPPPEATRYHHPGIIGRMGASISEYIQGLICVAEDEPQFKNGVFLKRETDHDNFPLVRIEHEYTANDTWRLEYLVKKAKQILGKSGGYFHQVKKMESFSHAVGTMRFGKTPENSVLDENCRFHALDNLFVLDGSFMPTSGGVNPSLTITANSLRVAEYIKGQFNWTA